jgi:hypothetical protein
MRKPPSASTNVIRAAVMNVSGLSLISARMSESGGSRNRCTSRARTSPSHAAMPAMKTAAAGAQSCTRLPTRRPSVPRGSGWTAVGA